MHGKLFAKIESVCTTGVVTNHTLLLLHDSNILRHSCFFVLALGFLLCHLFDLLLTPLLL